MGLSFSVIVPVTGISLTCRKDPVTGINLPISKAQLLGFHLFVNGISFICKGPVTRTKNKEL